MITHAFFCYQPSKEDIIDMEVFNQIIELDDDSLFVSSMVAEYLQQAEATFNNMDQAMYVLVLEMTTLESDCLG